MIALPVPTPVRPRRSTSPATPSRSRCPTRSARSSRGSSTRAAGRSPNGRATSRSTIRGTAHLPAVPPLRQLADGRDAALRRRARGARRPAPARRRQGVPRPRRGRDASRGARRDRVAGRRAVGLRDAARHRSSASATRSCSSTADAAARFIPFRVPEGRARARLAPRRRRAPACCAGLHRRATTGRSPTRSATLLDATRAHVGFVLRPAGEQALANVLHVAELARQVPRRTAASRSAASSTSCARPSGAPRRPRRRSSRRAATASG